MIYSTFASSLIITQRRKVAEFQDLIASRLGFGKHAMMAACFASAGERRESYATLMLRQLRYNKLEQAKLELFLLHTECEKEHGTQRILNNRIVHW